MAQHSWEDMKEEPGRMASLLGGGTLAALGLKRGGLLGLGLAALGGALAYQGATGTRVFSALSRQSRPVSFRRSIRLDAPRQEVWDYWRDQENLASFMRNVVRIERRSDTRFHWTVRGPLSVPLSWEAEIDPTPEGRRIAWKTLPGAEVYNEGEVMFKDAPGGGTEIDVNLHYHPPGGRMGHLFVEMMGKDPGHQLEEDLNRLKMILDGVGSSAGGPVTAAGGTPSGGTPSGGSPPI